MDRGLAQFQQPADYVGGGKSKTAAVGEKGYCYVDCTREQLLKLLTKKRSKKDE